MDYNNARETKARNLWIFDFSLGNRQLAISNLLWLVFGGQIL